MLSLVSPVFNEEESLDYFYREVKPILEKLKLDYEIIFVDDGSIDRSLNKLKDLAKSNSKIKIYSFRKNRGKSEALTLGFIKAKGKYVITLDADLQEDPKTIADMLKILGSDEFDVVCGWRKNRQDKKKMVIASKLFNKITNKLWGLTIHDYNCGFKAYRSEAVKALNLQGGMHRFIPLMLSSEGFRITEVPVVHQPRKFGKSKYSFSKVFNDIPDIFSAVFLNKYSKRPLHFFGFIGLFMIMVGALILLYLSVVWLMGHPIGTRPLLIFGVLITLSGLQSMFTGLLADLFISTNKASSFDDKLKYASD